MVFGSWAKYGSLYFLKYSQFHSHSNLYASSSVKRKKNIYLKFWSIKRRNIVNKNIKPKSIEYIKRPSLCVHAKESTVILNITFCCRCKMLKATITTTKNVTKHRYFWLKCKSHYWRRIWLLIIQFQVSNDRINSGMFFLSFFLY